MIRTIVPAFFVFNLPAEDADELAAATCEELNAALRRFAGASVYARYQLRLCEDSPSTELEVDTDDALPHSLMGFTIDSGSDRSATALIDHIVAIGEDSTKATATAFAEILTLARAWQAQRVALHPLGHNDG